jgi:hypothetical protein
MSFRGLCNWPPVWVPSNGKDPMSLRGEVGILSYVHASNGISRKCYLVMEHEGSRYVGCLIFDDPSFCYQVSMLLRTHVGRPIKEIGNLDVSSLL